MQIILIFLSYLLVLLNFDAPTKVSNMSNALLLAEHTGVLLLCSTIIKYYFPSKQIRSRYNLFCLVGYCVSLLYLYVEWGSSLVSHYTLGWEAFDPIKYYSMAADSIKTGNVYDGMTIFPVAYVWYYIMRFVGLNPLVPLFFNQVVLTYAICILVKFINGNSPSHIKYYSWLFVIPEVLSYTVTSSKDILCLLCATILFVKTAEMVRKRPSLLSIGIIALTFTVFVLARTSLAMASICGVMLTIIFSGRFSRRVIILSCVGFCMAAAASTLTGNMDTSAGDIADKVGTELSGDVSQAAELNEQANNSFAKRIIPHNSVEFIVYGFIRSVCYVVIDPRYIKSPIQTLMPFDGLNLQVCVDYTTLLMFISCIFIFFWIRRYWRTEDPNIKDTFIVAAIYWYAVGAFNPLMIHVRYRLVYDVLFFAVAIRAYIRYKERRKPRKQQQFQAKFTK